jgi:hypothetical protein
MTGRHPAPGPWLRLSALAAAAGTAVVVATGEWGRSHEAAVLGTLALTIGVAAAVTLGHRDRPALLAAAWTALAVFVVQVALGGLVALTDAAWLSGLHVALGAISLAASVVT